MLWKKLNILEYVVDEPIIQSVVTLIDPVIVHIDETWTKSSVDPMLDCIDSLHMTRCVIMECQQWLHGRHPWLIWYEQPSIYFNLSQRINGFPTEGSQRASQSRVFQNMVGSLRSSLNFTQSEIRNHEVHKFLLIQLHIHNVPGLLFITSTQDIEQPWNYKL